MGVSMAICNKCGAKILVNELYDKEGNIRSTCKMCEWVYRTFINNK